MPNWCSNRISATGPGAEVFARDFMPSFNRHKNDEPASSMDGVFITRACQLTAWFQSMGMKTLNEGEGPFNMAVFRTIRTNNAVEFASKWRNAYEIENLTCISTAYPHLSITYD